MVISISKGIRFFYFYNNFFFLNLFFLKLKFNIFLIKSNFLKNFNNKNFSYLKNFNFTVDYILLIFNNNVRFNKSNLLKNKLKSLEKRSFYINLCSYMWLLKIFSILIIFLSLFYFPVFNLNFLVWIFCLMAKDFIIFLKYFYQSSFFIPFSLAIISLLVFVVVVIIRIATPRFKIESLTKLGWSYGLIIIVIGFLFFLLGYFFI